MSEENPNSGSRTDWDRLRSMSDDDVDTSDLPEFSRDFYQRAELRIPRELMEVTLRVDPETYAWFRAQGEDWQLRLNAALRLYVEAHRSYPDKEKGESAA